MSHILPFVKTHGAGNDFVLIDNRSGQWTLEQVIGLTPRLCDRRFGVGADGLLALFPSEDHAYRMVYRNADGSDAGMCGNGGRCIAAYAIRTGAPPTHRFICGTNVYVASQAGSGIRLTFPVDVMIRPTDDGLRIDTGTDHLVVPVEAGRLSDTIWMVDTGRTLRLRHNANVNFVARIGDEIHIRTYERGVEDLTLACGTGALAAATWAHAIDGPVAVVSKGGTLTASLCYNPDTGVYHTYHLTGPVAHVYDGTIHL